MPRRTTVKHVDWPEVPLTESLPWSREPSLPISPFHLLPPTHMEIHAESHGATTAHTKAHGGRDTHTASEPLQTDEHTPVTRSAPHFLGSERECK